MRPSKPEARRPMTARCPAMPAPMMTIPAMRSADIDIESAVLDLHGIGLEIDAGWCPHGLAVGVVEAGIMLGAFYDVVHDEPVREMDLLMRAQAIGRIIFIIGRTIDREGPAAVFETDHVFGVNVFSRAGFDPVC